MTSQLIKILENIVPFSEEELRLIEPFIERISLQKNELLLEEGQYCSTLFFVESGSLRNFYNKDGVDINLTFVFENQFTSNIEAYISRELSRINIQAMEKSVVWVINRRAMQNAIPENSNISTFIRRIAIRILFATEEHHNMMMMNTPTERYGYILEKKPELIQRISLTHLASYLGITRETLSRIRSNKY